MSGAEDLRRPRALRGDERRSRRERSSRVASKPPASSARRRRTTDLVVRGVADDQEAASSDAIDDQVVDDAAVRVAEHRVLRLARLERRRVGDQSAQRGRAGIRRRDQELAHVREVEQAGAPRDGAVLVDDRRVLDRHLAAGEGRIQPTRRAPRWRPPERRSAGAAAGVGQRRSRRRGRPRPSAPPVERPAARWTTSRSVAWDMTRAPPRAGTSGPRRTRGRAGRVLPPIGRIRKKCTVLWKRCDHARRSS